MKQFFTLEYKLRPFILCKILSCCLFGILMQICVNLRSLNNVGVTFRFPYNNSSTTCFESLSNCCINSIANNIKDSALHASLEKIRINTSGSVYHKYLKVYS